MPNSDVIVIGGGVIGLACAHALARGGAEVRLLERGQCGLESSWAAAGIIMPPAAHRRDPVARLTAESCKLFPGFINDLRERTGIDPEFRVCGAIEVLLDEQQVRIAEGRERAGERSDLLGPEQTRRLEPALAGDFLAARHQPYTAQVRTPRLLKALRRAGELGGLQIHEHCPVSGLRMSAHRITGVRTPNGDFSAKHVVLAAGCWSSLLNERLAAQMPVTAVQGQMLLYEDGPPLRHIIERGLNYIVPRADGRILVGATQEAKPGHNKQVTPGSVASLAGFARKLVPDMATARLSAAWAGLRPGTPDHRPYIGPVPKMVGLIAATGHFRSGIIFTPVTAGIVADLVLQGRTERDLSAVLPDRKTPL